MRRHMRSTSGLVATLALVVVGLTAACGGSGSVFPLVSTQPVEPTTDEADDGQSADPTDPTDSTDPIDPIGAIGLPDPIDPNATSEVTFPPVDNESPPPQVPVEQDVIHLVRHSSIDPMAGGVEAISLLVPDTWQASSEAQWLPEWSRAAFLQTQVVDPVSGLTVDWLPIQDFIFFDVPAGFDVPIGGNYQGKAFVPPPTDAVQFVQDFWMSSSLSHLQGATVVNVAEVPAIADELVRLFAGPADAGAFRIRYAYSNNGVPWEQDVSFALLVSQANGITSWYVNFAWTVGAPAGEIDRNAALVSTVVASRISSPQWEATYRKVQDLFRQGIRQQMADTVAFGQALAAYRAEIQQLQQQVVDERAASQDRNAEIFRETLGGVEAYVDPVNGGFVELPLGFNDYYVNAQGEYLAVEQPGFDPNTLNDGVWTKLEPRFG